LYSVIFEDRKFENRKLKTWGWAFRDGDYWEKIMEYCPLSINIH